MKSWPSSLQVLCASIPMAVLTYSQHGKQLFLEKDLFFSNHIDSKTASAVLIYANEGKGFVDSRDSNEKIDTLEVGPDTGNGLRILVLDEGRDTFVHQDVQMSVSSRYGRIELNYFYQIAELPVTC